MFDEITASQSALEVLCSHDPPCRQVHSLYRVLSHTHGLIDHANTLAASSTDEAVSCQSEGALPVPHNPASSWIYSSADALLLLCKSPLLMGDNNFSNVAFSCLIFILCVFVFCLPVYLYSMCMAGANGGQKRASDHLVRAVSRHIGAGSRILALWKNNPCLTLEPSLRSPHLNINRK